MYVYMRIYILVCIYVCVYIYIWLCTCVYKYIFSTVSKIVYLYFIPQTYICTHTSNHMHIYTNTLTYIYIYIYKNVRTQVHVLRQCKVIVSGPKVSLGFFNSTNVFLLRNKINDN